MSSFVSLSRATISTALNVSEISPLVFGILLVLGLVGEYSEHSRRKKFFEMLVIIGVAGELVADGGIFLFSARLQTLADAEVASLNREAAIAKANAEQARKDTQSLQLQVAGTNERAARAEAETARLNKLAEDTRLAEAERERIRRTAPQVAASLARSTTAKVILSFQSANLIPFEYRYAITTENNELVAGFPITMSKVYPTKVQNSFSLPVDLQLDRVRNNYIELRFTFQSLSYDELHLPGHAAEIVKKYRLAPDDTTLEAIP